MIRVGIVGMGFGASMHVPLCIEHKDLLITALADNGSGAAKLVGHNAGLYEARVFGSGRELALSDAVDAVVVAAPASSQRDIVVTALKSGKHVLCEKPMGLTLIDAEEICEASLAVNMVTAVCYEYRYDKVFSKLFRVVNSGRLGKIKGIEVDWHTSGSLNPDRIWSWKSNSSAGGGVVQDWLPHVLDYVFNLTGASSLENLDSRSWVEAGRLVDLRGSSRAVTAPDNCLLEGQLSTGSSARISISTTCDGASYHKVKVVGDSGSVLLKHNAPFDEDSYELSGSLQGKFISLPGGRGSSGCIDTRRDAMKCLFDDFSSAIKTGLRPCRLPSFDDGLRVWKSISLT